MNAKRITEAVGIVASAALLILSGCSGENESAKKPSLVDQVADSFASSLADNIIEARHSAAGSKQDTTGAFGVTANGGPHGISDMMITDSVIYAVDADGLLMYGLSDKSATRLNTEEPLHALTWHGGKVYAGGKDLYALNGTELEAVDVEFHGTINALSSFDLRLLVGTTAGLYSRSIFGDELLLDDVSVTTMASAGDALWVGTDGQGLYRWDGADFKKRYLSRDPSLFDYVNCLAFNREHLYVGTDSAMFIFDGGKWETLTAQDGLPSDYIKAVDASNWLVYVATDRGVISYFNGDFIPVAKLGDKNASSIRVLGRKIFVGTEDEGILMKSGPVLKVLIGPDEPADDEPSDVFSSSF
jgi:ligand-binding sensor domain-containing protein